MLRVEATLPVHPLRPNSGRVSNIACMVKGMIDRSLLIVIYLARSSSTELWNGSARRPTGSAILSPPEVMRPYTGNVVLAGQIQSHVENHPHGSACIYESGTLVAAASLSETE